MPLATTSDSSPNRVNSKRGGDRGRARRKAERALARAMQTSAAIQGTSRARQRHRAAGEANTAEALTTDLRGLYTEFQGDKREVYSSGYISEPSYKGKTWRAS